MASYIIQSKDYGLSINYYLFLLCATMIDLGVEYMDMRILFFFLNFPLEYIIPVMCKHSFHRTNNCVWLKFNPTFRPVIGVLICVLNHTWWTFLTKKICVNCCEVIEAEWRIYLSVNWTSIGSDNGLSPDRHQTIIWTNAGLLWIRIPGINFSEIQIMVMGLIQNEYSTFPA